VKDVYARAFEAANSHRAYAVAVIVLTFPVVAMNVLLDRIFFTEEERLEIGKQVIFRVDAAT
jgi:hypothetical protein